MTNKTFNEILWIFNRKNKFQTLGLEKLQFISNFRTNKMSKRVPDRIQICSSDKPSNTVNTFWGLCKNPRAKHGGNSSSFRCVPEQFLSSLSCVLDLAVEVVHSSHIPGSGLPGNQAVDQIQSGLGQFQAQNSKSFLDFSHTTLN